MLSRLRTIFRCRRCQQVDHAVLCKVLGLDNDADEATIRRQASKVAALRDQQKKWEQLFEDAYLDAMVADRVSAATFEHDALRAWFDEEPAKVMLVLMGKAPGP